MGSAGAVQPCEGDCASSWALDGPTALPWAAGLNLQEFPADVADMLVRPQLVHRPQHNALLDLTGHGYLA